MKNAAVILGIMGGILALILAVWADGRMVVSWLAGHAGAGPGMVLAGLIAPVAALAGGAMAVLAPRLAAALMLAAAAGMAWGQGWGLINAVPVALCALGGVLALAGNVVKAAA